IQSLLEMGVISKSEDKNFNPLRNITREEFVKMIVAALDLHEEDIKTTFFDVEEGQWYYSYCHSRKEWYYHVQRSRKVRYWNQYH
ncbi:MAG: S-layer homology domain-containing protein, partial [Clostridiales bacterium]|nr:S-layer homology domain-containing protein [Clostridiales bacterium]